MANLLTLKRRIKAAGNVSKTTKAMQMIAASKLKRAQDATLSTRPYVSKLSELTSVLGGTLENFSHPYLETREVGGKNLFIVLSPDKGLCGGLVTNLLREFISQKSASDKFLVIGKKVEQYVVRTNSEVIASFSFGTTLPTFESILPILSVIEEQYLSGKVQSVRVLYSEFVNAFSQKPLVKKILPLTFPEEQVDKKKEFMLFEPDAAQLMPGLLKHYLEMQVYQILLESYLSEQASRMVAMQNATNNANEIIDYLKLEYNKTRQAKITSEILDITSSKRAFSS